MMSMEVRQFLSESGGNFTESAPRPPVPGEENELQSNGGNSSRSSGSYKSHISGRSHSSGKSVASHRSDVCHSPAATPRRSNLDKIGLSETKLEKEVDAPLGFEPEGSAASSPPFTENSTPPYLKWAENLKYLLEDSDGVKLFKIFLDQEQGSNALDFWFACSGLKLVNADDKEKVQSLVKLIYKKYIKGDHLSLKAQIKSAIIDRMKHDLVDQTIFDSAQTDVENAMRSDTYPLFLKSDIYVQYVQNGGESPKQSNDNSNDSSGRNSVRPVSGPLPTLVEDKVLEQGDFKKPAEPASLTLTTSALLATSSYRVRQTHGPNMRKPDGAFPTTLRSGVPAYPYHVSYAPVSAQDSELQSLSSDACTDDTMSLTDSSVDGREVPPYGGLHSKSAWKKHHKHLRSLANTNKSTDLNQQLIPRTERAPKDRNLAEKDPAKFAKMLSDRLQQIKDDLDKNERVKESMQNIETDEEEVDTSQKMQPPPPKSCQQQQQQPNNNTSISELILGGQASLMATVLHDESREEGDEAQSILEAHVSRIWDSSNGQTPSRSPGRHSPKSTSPDRSFRSRVYGGGAHPTPNTSATGNSMLYPSLPTKSHRRKKEKDNMFMFNSSVDSSLGVDDRTGYPLESSYTHKHVHHYHHHHHHVPKDKARHTAAEEPARSMNYYVSNPHMHTEPHGVGLLEESPAGRQKRPSKKCTDSSSNIDSGVSGMHSQVPNSYDPNYNKVVSWMLENEKIHSTNTQYSTDGSDKGSSHKRSHKSSASQNKSSNSSGHGSGKKQPVQYNASRTGPLDHSGVHSFPAGDYSFNQAVAGVLPSQPIGQDPSMPLLPSPNPTTQLEEVKRRLEQDEASKQRLLKSKSFTGSTSLKEKGRMLPPPAVPPRPAQNRNIPPTVPLDLSTSESSTESGWPKSDKRLPKKASSVPTTPSTQADETVVGYFFCGEPIPYRTTIAGKSISLAMFKQVISKKGNYRYFFKTVSDEFDSGMVLMEVTDEMATLPLWEGKIVGKVEKVE